MSKSGFARAAGLMMVAVLASRLLGVLRESVIAGRFGQGELTDLYRAAFGLPDVLFFMVAGGALSSAFVPVFTDYITRGEEKEAWKTYSIVTSVMGVVIGVLILLGIIFARSLVPIISPGFSEAQWDETARLTRIVLPSQFFFFMGGLIMGTLYARKHFLIPALGPLIYNLGIIMGGIFLGGMFGIAGLCWGALGGAITGNFILQIWYARKLGVSYRFCLDISHPGARKVFSLMLPVILGLSIANIDILINRIFGTFLAAGSISALENANRLMQVPLGLFGQAAGIVALPMLSALAAQKNFREYRETLNFGIRSIFFAMIPASFFMIVLAKPIVAFILQAGAFDAEDTIRCSQALVFYALGTFAWGGQAIMARGFYALHDTKTPIIIGSVMTAIFMPMNWFVVKLAEREVVISSNPLIQSLIGHSGLALSTSFIAVSYLLVLSFSLARRVDGIGAGRIVSSALKVCLASLLASVACWLVAAYISPGLDHSATLTVKKAAALQIFPGLAAFLLVFIPVCRVLKVEELQTYTDMIGRRFGKKRANGSIPPPVSPDSPDTPLG